MHDKDLNVLLLERADRNNFWQSITGSVDYLEEDLLKAAQRELKEETGIIESNHNWLNWNFSREFKIFSQWKFKYEDNVEFNTEHIFSVCVEPQKQITLSPREHVNFEWLFWKEAAEKCFSWTNVLAIKELPARFQKKN